MVPFTGELVIAIRGMCILQSYSELQNIDRNKSRARSNHAILLFFRGQTGWFNVYLQNRNSAKRSSLVFDNKATQVNHNKKHTTLNIQNLYM